MGKYINKSTLVAEIERRIKEILFNHTENALISKKVYKEILSFIDTLEVKEQPANRELEEEFVSYVKEKFGIRQEGAVLKTDGLTISPYDLLDIAKYFAQWQKQRVADKACKWLEGNKEHPFIECEDPCLSGYLTDKFIEDFKKAMEE